MGANYTIYHCHTQLSLIDSVTKYQDYVDRAKECGMQAMAISEHGNIYEYYHKKQAIEAAGMKYIHAVEAYITEDPGERVRDNYHLWLGARNYDGFHELNRLISESFNRGSTKIVGDEERYYYNPRISLQDIYNTSDNIIICTACIASILSKGGPKLQEEFLRFLEDHKDRCFLEIQHHNVDSQIAYNKRLYQMHKETGIPLIAGTDTHALNETHVKGRTLLQNSKGIYYSDEDGWDLTFKTYGELVTCYERQAAIPMDAAMTAIENTNVMADLVEPFELTTETKYPHIYNNPVDTFKKKINKAYDRHRYAKSGHKLDEMKSIVQNELAVYQKTKSIDFMLLQSFLREWEKSQGIQCGYGRGSVSGSEIAYILGITEMDSARFGLNFFRFMNPDRVTNADIDTDYSGEDRERVKEFLLKDHMGLPQIQCSEIITFNTIALKGAIRDVCRGLYKDRTDINYLDLADSISKRVESEEEAVRQEYPEVFEYVDILNGTVVSVGSHPSGVLVTDVDLAEQIGLCSMSTSKYPVSMLNMRELDALMYVKLDCLGLDNIGIINDTCKMLGIDRLTPDNVDLEDEAVWKSIRDNTCLIFQWESDSAQDYIRRFMSDRTIAIAKQNDPNFSYIKWLSFGNGLIRPGCASFRDDVADGHILITGFKELDEFLAKTFGRITMQEDIMQFLVKFCGYSGAESDTVRRGIAKKYGTEKFITEIHDRFLSYSSEHYGQKAEDLDVIFEPIKQGILDASSYAFSWNHSDSYSCIGYICGYLRYYHPVEFLTAALNIFQDKPDKKADIVAYALENNIRISSVRFGHSSSKYTCDAEARTIYEAISSIKYMSATVSEELYALRDNKYESFIDVLLDIKDKTSCDARQLDTLIRLDYFHDFGNPAQLLEQLKIFDFLNGRKSFKISSITEDSPVPLYMIRQYARKQTEKTLSDLDWLGLCRAACEKTADIKTPGVQKLRWELEILGYVQTVLPKVSCDYYIVTGFEGRSEQFFVLYQLQTGKSRSIRYRKKYREQNPTNTGDIIKVIEEKMEGKWTKNELGEWVRNWDDLEPNLIRWSVIN